MLFVLLLEVISCLSVERRNRDKLELDGPLGSNADFTFSVLPVETRDYYCQVLLLLVKEIQLTGMKSLHQFRKHVLQYNFSAFEVLKTSFWCFAFFRA